MSWLLNQDSKLRLQVGIAISVLAAILWYIMLVLDKGGFGLGFLTGICTGIGLGLIITYKKVNQTKNE